MGQLENDNHSHIHFKGHKILVLYPESPESLEDLKQFDAIVVSAKHSAFASFTARKIRSSLDPEIYLKPVYFLKASSDFELYIKSIIDGNLFDTSELQTIISDLREVLIRIDKVSRNKPISFEAQVIFRMLTLSYTRNRKELNPIPYVFSGINFAFPGISESFEHYEEHKVFELLYQAETEGFLKSEFYDKTHYCNSCNHGSLNYRPCCPKCGYSDSDTQDIVHHFPCGYVGPEGDFQNELDDTLNCPKCSKTLRHIGVDYDKPSVLHTCMRCDNKYQEFEVKAKCLRCGFDNPIEELVEKQINKYRITSKGELAAVNGYIATTKDIEDIIGTVKYDFFEMLVKYEVERIRQTEGKSNIAIIYMEGVAGLLAKIGQARQRSLVIEIVEVIRNWIRSSDVISFKDASTVVISMFDIPRNVSKNILIDIVGLLDELIRDNFENLEINFQTHVKKLDSKTPYKEQIQALSNRVNG